MENKNTFQKTLNGQVSEEPVFVERFYLLQETDDGQTIEHERLFITKESAEAELQRITRRHNSHSTGNYRATVQVAQVRFVNESMGQGLIKPYEIVFVIDSEQLVIRPLIASKVSNANCNDEANEFTSDVDAEEIVVQKFGDDEWKDSESDGDSIFYLNTRPKIVSTSPYKH